MKYTIEARCIFISLLVIALSAVLSTCSVTPILEGYGKHRDHNVTFHFVKSSYVEAERKCRNYGGKLFGDLETFLMRRRSLREAYRRQSYWLGISDIHHPGKWVNSTGHHITSVVANTIAHCLAYLNDTQPRFCDAAHFYVCVDETDTTSTCNETQWMCNDNSTCIPRDLVMDGNQDCPDNSDEVKPIMCLVREFQCRESNRCIARHKVMDGAFDCSGRDGSSDEITSIRCFSIARYKDEFSCRVSGRCIPSSWINDGIQQCVEGEDETNTKQLCHFLDFPCADGLQCVPKYKFRNGIVDCRDESDESDKLDECQQSQLRCNKTKLCVDLIYHMDLFDQCGDESDELKVPNCDKLYYFKCQVNKRCIPRYWVRDGRVDCLLSHDERRTPLKCLSSEVQCEDKRACVPRINFRDGIKQCRDNSDETVVLKCNDHEFQCHSTQQCVPRKDVNRNDDVCRGSAINIAFKCHSDEFMCKVNSQCIENSKIKNYVEDCPDGSDENELNQCPSDRFQCPTEAKCISRSFVNNGVHDCVDGSDENITSFSCLPTEIKCPDENRCISRSVINVNNNNCVQNKVKGYPLNCTNDEFRCTKSRRCVSRRLLKDGVNDCTDLSDENSTELVQYLFPCRDNEFSCSDGSRCLWSELRCDGIANCEDLSDELNCSAVNSTQYMFPCNTPVKETYFNRNYFCDGFQDCDNGFDEALVGFGLKCNVTKSFITRRCIIPSYFINSDNATECDDGSDNDETMQTSCIDGMTIHVDQYCDGVFDCLDLSDECLCETLMPTKVCDHLFCPNKFLCFSHTYLCDKDVPIHSSKICNSVMDCLDGSDEAYCVLHQDDGVRSKISNFTCTKVSFFTVAEISRTISRTGVKCDGVIDCELMDDECNVECTLVPWFCNSTVLVKSMNQTWRHCREEENVLITKDHICDGKRDCHDGGDEKECPDRYKCNVLAQPSKDITIVSIDRKKVCDLKIDCEDGLDESNCSVCYSDAFQPTCLGRFYCKSENPLFVKKSSVQDGKIDCDDASDECSSELYLGREFASKDHSIRSPSLRVIVWILSLSSTLLNGIVITIRIVIQYNRRGSNSRAKFNEVLFFSIVAADLLMGLYYLAISIHGAVSAGKYCLIDKAWRTSWQCRFVGSLHLVSNRASLSTLTFVGIFRLRAVIYPYRPPVRVSICCLLVGITWILMIVPTYVLTISSITYKLAWITSSPFFSGNTVSKGKLSSFVAMREKLIFGNYVEQSSLSWKTISQRLNFESSGNLSNIVILGYYSFYSDFSICMPQWFHKWSRPYTFARTGMVAFVAVYGVIPVICHLITVWMLHHNRAKFKFNLSLQRSVTYIMINTCTACAIVGACSLADLAGVQISTYTKNFVCLIVIPLSTTINPVIYLVFNHWYLIKTSVTGFLIV